MTTPPEDDDGRLHRTPRGAAPADRVELPPGQGVARRRTPPRGGMLPPLPLPAPPDENVPESIEGETSAVIMLEPDPEKRLRRWAAHQATKPPPLARTDLNRILVQALVGLLVTAIGGAATFWVKVRDDLRDRPTRNEITDRMLVAYPTKLEIELRVDEVEDQVDDLQRQITANHPAPAGGK